MDLAEARKVLETHIARSVAKTITADAIAALEKTIEVIEADPTNIDLCAEQDIEFHNVIIHASGNVVFEIMLAPLAELLRESRKKTVSRGLAHVVEDHGQIIAALREHNSEEAADCMSRHLDIAIRYLKE